MRARFYYCFKSVGENGLQVITVKSGNHTQFKTPESYHIKGSPYISLILCKRQHYHLFFSYGSQLPRSKLCKDLSQPLARFTATHMYVPDSRWAMYKSFTSILALCMKGLKLTRSSEVQISISS